MSPSTGAFLARPAAKRALRALAKSPLLIPRGVSRRCNPCTTTEILDETTPTDCDPEASSSERSASRATLSDGYVWWSTLGRFRRVSSVPSPRARPALTTPYPPCFFHRGGTTSTSAAVLAASAPAVASRDAPATQDLKVDKVSDEVAVAAGEFASSRARQAPLPDPPKPQRQCVTRPLPFFRPEPASRSLAGPDLQTHAFPAETESKMPSGVKSENPTSHSAPPRRQRRRCAPRRCELRMSPPFTQLPTFPPRRATSRRPISPLSPTPRPSFHLQTHKHEAIPAKGGAQADVSTSRDGAHPITPRGFILLVYFHAGVGPSRATPDAIARTRGGTRHRATSTSLSWTRAFDSIGLGRVFSPNGDAMVEKSPSAAPTPVGVSGESRRGLGSARGAIARAIGGRLRTVSRRRASRGCPRGLVTLGGESTWEIARGARSAPRRPCRYFLSTSIFASSFNTRFWTNPRSLGRRTSAVARARATGSPSGSFSSRRRPRSIRGDRRASSRSRVAPRATAGARHVGKFRERIVFLTQIFFPPSSRRRQEAEGDQVDRVGGAEVLQRAQGTALTPKNAPDPRRVAVGPPIPHLPFPRVRRRRARKRRPPFFFHASRRPRR